MSAQVNANGENPFLITPPPGLIPETPAPQPNLESGTRRISRNDRPARSAEIPAFFPTVIGLPATPAAPLSWVVTLPDGATQEVSSVLVLGRNPSAVAGWPSATLLAVIDQQKTVSKTHAALEREGDDLWVHDLDSTNGVVIVGSDGTPTEVLPGTRARIESGSRLELGSFVLTITAA